MARYLKVTVSMAGGRTGTFLAVKVTSTPSSIIYWLVDEEFMPCGITYISKGTILREVPATLQ